MEIEKGIPLPPMIEGKVSMLKSMEVGESILVSREACGRWRGAMQKAQSRGEYYFTSRTVDGGVRIWRKA